MGAIRKGEQDLPRSLTDDPVDLVSLSPDRGEQTEPSREKKSPRGSLWYSVG